MKTPKYRKHSLRDSGFVEWKGKRYYFSGSYNSAESKACYRRFLREHVLADPLPIAANESISVAVLVDRFLTWAEKHYPTGSRSEYMNVRCATNYLGKFAMLPADEFGPLKLKEVQQDIATQKRSRYYVNSVTSRIKRAFKWAASEELINPSTYHALLTVQGIQRGRTNAKESSPVQPVAWQHVEPVLAELSPVLAAMVRLQWFTAARSGSLVQAHVEQFDCKASPWVWKPRHKTEYRGHDLALFIGPQAQAAITPYMGSGYLFRPQEHAKNRRFGKHYTSGSYRQAIDRAIDRVNQERAKSKQDAIPAWTPHQLRHSRATAVRASHGLEAAQAVLGHENLETTQIYAERNLLLARQIALQSG